MTVCMFGPRESCQRKLGNGNVCPIVARISAVFAGMRVPLLASQSTLLPTALSFALTRVKLSVISRLGRVGASLQRNLPLLCHLSDELTF